MSLKKCENTTIGYPGSMNGISGGEKKRLAFSEKLFAKPSIMFCDEPTSGLDSFGARNVIEALRDLASIGHTVLATIHQPSSEVFAMFDELRYYCPNNYNISDFLMNTLAIVPGEETMGQEKIAFMSVLVGTLYWRQSYTSTGVDNINAALYTMVIQILYHISYVSAMVEGCILVNGKNIGEDIYKISDYVQQDNVFIGTLTVKEHLWFNAMLRLDKRISYREKKTRVEEIMTEMSLKKCENTTIGYPGISNGISGGERKRLAFAEKLFTKPSIMFCDEPTSGLDSFSARSVVQALRDLASTSHTVLATIHQPSSEVFAMFDELRYYCPNNYNTSDFLMNTLAIVPGEERRGQDKITRICKYFEESSYFKEMKHQIQVQMQIDNNMSDVKRCMEIFPVLVKEHYDRQYSVSALCLANFLIEVTLSL
ncbi:hypothetical protein LSH36_566g01155 [Paralvinella palmiformis]|uniref:ABC transporter domain-containing protein n=1 Tax=Paralvinella palmiformis TaxID=53620 RepID=A0AAD9MVC4_9ANNE|nr:hypothetical protein LSH36_566g01155 [Paralvinella palmiformis]